MTVLAVEGSGSMERPIAAIRLPSTTIEASRSGGPPVASKSVPHRSTVVTRMTIPDFACRERTLHDQEAVLGLSRLRLSRADHGLSGLQAGRGTRPRAVPEGERL